MSPKLDRYGGIVTGILAIAFVLGSGLFPDITLAADNNRELRDAVREGDLEKVKRLLESSPDLIAMESMGWKPLV